MNASTMQMIGKWAFILGVLIALVLGLAAGYLGTNVSYAVAILVILGLVIGFLNISSKEVTDFLIAAIALTALAATGAGLSQIPIIGSYLQSMVNYIAFFVGPGALVVSLKAVYNLAKTPHS